MENEIDIHPLMEGCESYFRYLDNGELASEADLPQNDKEKANKTIQILGLNIEKLKKGRESTIDQLTKEIVNSSPEDRDYLIRGFLAREGNGHYSKYQPAIDYILRDFVRRK